MTSGELYDSRRHMRDDGNWVNWHGNVSCQPAQYHVPGSEKEIQTIVRNARSAGTPVRVAGSGHSCTPLNVTPGVLIHLDNMRGVIRSDLATKRFTARAGTQIFELGPALWDSGLCLSNQGDIDVQTIAGAIGTGTHGSGVNLGSLSSAVRGVRLINGLGEIVDIDESQPDLLHAAQVSMGMLGIVTEVTMEASPAHHLEESVEYPLLEDIFTNWDHYLATYRHFSYWWLASPAAAANFEVEYPEGTSYQDSVKLKLYRALSDDEPVTIGGEYGSRVDRSYKIYPEHYEPTFVEMEFMIPLRHSRSAIADFQTLVASHPDSSWSATEVRFMAGDEAFLSPAYGEPVLVVAAAAPHGEEEFTFLRSFEELALTYGGRPHWGKLHFLTKDQVRAAYPKYDEFVEIRRRFDPDGLFLNDHLRELFE